MHKSFFITTMGCQMNENDSDYLSQALINLGLSAVKEPHRADVILVNTCTVRAKPEQKAYSLLGRISNIKKKRPNIIIGVTGCLAQQYGAHLMERFPRLDFVMGPREIERIQEIVRSVNGGGNKVVATDLKSAPPCPIYTRGYFSGRFTGYISIMEGCNNFCSYCIVPYVRGREISRSPEDILYEARKLVSEGVKDITFLGQNVNSYRWNRGTGKDFAGLLKDLEKVDGLMRLRFITSHPKDLSDDLIHCFGDIDSLCPHLHLPLQAGSNRILKLMKREYTREAYLMIIQKIRAIQPEIAITSDVMVGFPGEKEKDFQLSMDLIEQVQFDSIFSFKYSDRKGTFAQKMRDKVEEDIKSSRLSALQSLQKEITLQKNRALEGKEVDVLVEGYGKREGQMMGRTGSNKVVNFIGDNSYLGKLINVKIKRGFVNSLQGQVMSSNS